MRVYFSCVSPQCIWSSSSQAWTHPSHQLLLTLPFPPPQDETCWDHYIWLLLVLNCYWQVPCLLIKKDFLWIIKQFCLQTRELGIPGLSKYTLPSPTDIQAQWDFLHIIRDFCHEILQCLMGWTRVHIPAEWSFSIVAQSDAEVPRATPASRPTPHHENDASGFHSEPNLHWATRANHVCWGWVGRPKAIKNSYILPHILGSFFHYFSFFIWSLTRTLIYYVHCLLSLESCS